MYFADTGTQVLVEDPACQKPDLPKPSATLLGPACHDGRVFTLVCVAQDFPYAWPLDVRWQNEAGEELPRLAMATEPVRPTEGSCSFGIASRLSLLATEWQKGHKYSCHVYQGNVSVDSDSLGSSHMRLQGGLSEMELGLRTGQLIFLLLTIKSFVYGAALAVYTTCWKTGRTTGL